MSKTIAKRHSQNEELQHWNSPQATLAIRPSHENCSQLMLSEELNNATISYYTSSSP